MSGDGRHIAQGNLYVKCTYVKCTLSGSTQLQERTKKAAVTKALQEFIARRRQKRLLDLLGKLEWDSSYDYKAGRARD